MSEKKAYLAIPAPRNGREQSQVSPYLYSGAMVAESGKLGVIVVGPAQGGFSMDVTRDRLASGLIFGKVFFTMADARLHLYDFAN